MIDPSTPEISARLACLERKLEAVWRIVDQLLGAAFDDARRELSAEQLCQMRSAVVQAGVETVNRLRAAS